MEIPYDRKSDVIWYNAIASCWKLSCGDSVTGDCHKCCEIVLRIVLEETVLSIILYNVELRVIPIVLPIFFVKILNCQHQRSFSLSYMALRVDIWYQPRMFWKFSIRIPNHFSGRSCLILVKMEYFWKLPHMIVKR